MKPIPYLIIFATLIYGCSGSNEPGNLEPRTEQELVNLYKKHHKQKNLDEMMTLFYQNETPSIIINSHREHTEKSFEYPIVRTEISPVSKEKKNEALEGYPYLNGETIVVNLDPIKVLKIVMTHPEMQYYDNQIMIGKIENTHYFVLSKFK